MDYQNHYDLLIKKHGYQIKPDDGYYERHHIIPRCLGGGDESDNLVYLTAKAHYVAHLLLCGVYEWKNNKINYALWLMSNISKRSKNKIRSRMYGKIRLIFAEQHRKNMTGENNPVYGKKYKGKEHGCWGREMSLETREKISNSLKGKMKGVPKTEKHRRKISNSLKGKNTWTKGKTKIRRA